MIVVRIWTGGVDEETMQRRLRRGYLIAKQLQSEGKKEIYLKEEKKVAPPYLVNGIEVVESPETEDASD